MQFPAQRRSKGFALLITITLLAFLVLLLVSLASLTRVETQVASNSQQLAQARQNALMALNIALGELQKYAGPDQRVTARSDMDWSLYKTLGTDASAATPSVKVSGRWAGVYGSSVSADYSEIPSTLGPNTGNPTSCDAKGSQAKLLNWLVSGNEGTSFDPSAHVGTNGQITTAPSSINFTPTGAVSGLLANGTPLDPIKIKDKNGTDQDARLLVGANTVGTSIADYVAAPLREIDAVTPGTGTTAVPIGRYAWWVGDEGMKARLNLPMSDPAQAANAFVSSQRPAVELVDASHTSVSTTLLTNDMMDPTNSLSRYNPAASTLTKLLSSGQLPILAPASSTALAATAKYRFHDLTVHSTSVLSDTYAGGLKKDLSAILATGATSPLDTDFIFPPEPNQASPLNCNQLTVPTWGQLRSFAQTSSPSTGLIPRTPTMAMSPNAAFATTPVPTNVGINPILTYAAFGFRYIAPDGDAVGNRIRIAAVPIIVLWNPYTTPISGKDSVGNPIRYEVGIRKAFASQIQLQGRAASTGAIGSYTWSASDVIENVDMGRTNATPYYRFTIESPAGGIPAGESLIFTLKQNGQDYSETNNVSNILTNGMNDDYYVVLPGSATITPALGAGAYYRVAANATTRTVNSVVINKNMWGYGNTDGNFGGAGNGWHEGYLGSPATGTNYPTGSYPWKTTAGFPAQGLYQSYGLIGSPYVGTPPYGNGSAGYAVASGASGLVQPEGVLGTNMTAYAPTFRMVIRSLFSNAGNNLPSSRGRWMLSNIRGFMMPSTLTGQPTQSSWPFDISSSDDLHASSGISLNSARNDTILYEFRPDTMPLLSIGQLQHANLGWCGSPAFAIGNSNGSGFIQYDYPLGNQFPPRLDTTTITATKPERLVRLYQMNGNAPGDKVTAYYDYSWLLNRAIWDRYFVSTVPHAGTGKNSTPADTNSSAIPAILPNPLHIDYGTRSNNLTALRDADKAASKLLLAGGFNINSTSEQAWRAILGGTNQLNYDPTGTNTGGSAWPKSVFSRFSKPTTNSTTSPWLGYRQLTETQIAQFAKNIVAEIRNRGPFISLADFINRRLYTSNATIKSYTNTTPTDPFAQPSYDDTRIKGTIQAALDIQASPLLSPALPASSIINNPGVGSPLNIFSSTTPNYKVSNAYNGASIDAFGTGNSTPASPVPPFGTSGAGAPQFLTQADVLATIGSQLTARSDTFVIRTYGEVLDPVNSTSTSPVILGSAWCEATVQRLPDYVDDSMPAETDLRTAVTSAAKTTNQTFGRKFKIISFRWLSSTDI